MATRTRRTTRAAATAGGEPVATGRRRSRPEKKSSLPLVIGLGAGALVVAVALFFFLRGSDDGGTRGLPPVVASPTSTPALAPDAGAPAPARHEPVPAAPAPKEAPPAEPPKPPPPQAKPVTIDPYRDFPGLDDLQGTSQTYMLAEFLAMRGKSVMPAEREAAIARWTARRAVIEARVEEAAGDPFLTKIDRTRNELAHKPYFATLPYDVIESTRPYALFVENPGDTVTERDARREAVEKAYKPFLEAYDRTIHRYLQRLSPAPPKEDPTFIVFILRDRESYDRFFVEFERYVPPGGMRAHYSPQQKWAFTYSPEVEDVKDPDFGEGTQSLLHEITHAWIDRLATADGGRTYDGNLVQTHWFNEGIAEFMSCHFLDDWGIVKFQPWKSMRLAKSNPKLAAARIPFERAFKIGRHQGLVAEALSVANAQKELDPAIAVAFALPGFYADMSLFIFWLNFANGGKSKRSFEDYVRKELSGDGGPEVADRIFADVFAMKDLEQTVDAFQQEVVEGKLEFEDRDFEVEE